MVIVFTLRLSIIFFSLTKDDRKCEMMENLIG